jgi:hypothetical protein
MKQMQFLNTGFKAIVSIFVSSCSVRYLPFMRSSGRWQRSVAVGVQSCLETVYSPVFATNLKQGNIFDTKIKFFSSHFALI